MILQFRNLNNNDVLLIAHLAYVFAALLLIFTSSAAAAGPLKTDENAAEADSENEAGIIGASEDPDPESDPEDNFPNFDQNYSSAFAGQLIQSPRMLGDDEPCQASCMIWNPFTSFQMGNILIVQKTQGGPVTFKGELVGLPPGSVHGFHIHEKGNEIGSPNYCDSAGAHFNPFNVSHGGPQDQVRHVGDLGNLIANAKGVITVDIVDTLVSLSWGVKSIVGRSCVLHSDPDDLGRGSSPTSKTNGNSGTRIGCGLVGLVD